MNLWEDSDVVCERFIVKKFLGRGMVGEGYLCTDRLLENERVVCKVALKCDETAWKEFREQYRKLQRIRSSGVVRCHGIFEHESHAVLALEWIDGNDLTTWVQGKPSLKARLDALAQIASALRSLHDEKMTHGDLWGGVNVMAGSSRGCVLIDPDPELWGRSSGSSESRVDVESLVSLIGEMASELKLGPWRRC